jgi:hypothetical protein
MAKKKSNSPKSMPGSVVTIGLDVGYGVVKAIAHSAVITFPSVMGHAREIKFQQEDITARHPDDQIMDDEGEWFVGELALAQLPPGEVLRLRGRTANESTMGNALRLRLAKVAIGKLLNGMWNRDVVHLRIASGLPVDHMCDAADLKATLTGQHLIKTDTAEIIANVDEVMVMPQPDGSIYAATLTEAGEINEHHTYMRKAGVWRVACTPPRNVSLPPSNATTGKRCPTRSSNRYYALVCFVPAANRWITPQKLKKHCPHYAARLST